MSAPGLVSLILVILLLPSCGTDRIENQRTSAPREIPIPSSSPEASPHSKESRPALSSPAPLPELPSQGFVVGGDHNLFLVDLEGELIATLSGFAVAGQTRDRSAVWLRRGPHFFRLGPGATQLKPVNRGTWRHNIHAEPDPPDLPPPQGARSHGVISGHWRYALRSPISDVLLAQWSDECEVPSAHFIYPGSDPVHVSGPGRLWRLPSSHALGWTPNGLALVYVPVGACGGGGDPPGIYAFTEPGVSALIFETKGYPSVAMWGDATRAP